MDEPGKIRRDGRVKSYFKGGRIPPAKTRGQTPPKPERILWEVYDPAKADEFGILIYQSKKAADEHAARLYEKCGVRYEVRQVDHGGTRLPMLEMGKAPDPTTTKIFELITNETVNFAVIKDGEDPNGDCYLNFAVRDSEMRHQQVSIKLSVSQYGGIVRYLLRRL